MAITQYTEPATTNPTLTDWQSSIARDNASSRGFAEVDLDDYDDGATAPKVAVGSRFDNNGALYVVSGADEDATGIAAIANSTTFYIYYDVSEGEFLADTTAPSFDKEKRGWYNGNDRALFRIYKDSGGDYDRRVNLLNTTSISLVDIVGNRFETSQTVSLTVNTSWTPPMAGLYSISSSSDDVLYQINTTPGANGFSGVSTVSGLYYFTGLDIVPGGLLDRYHRIYNSSGSSSRYIYYTYLG